MAETVKTATTPLTVFERIMAEGPLPIHEAAALNGVHIHPGSALRQAINGVRGARLETIRLDGRKLTSAAAYRRFILAQQDDAADPPAALGDQDVDRALSAYGLGRSRSKRTNAKSGARR